MTVIPLLIIQMLYLVLPDLTDVIQTDKALMRSSLLCARSAEFSHATRHAMCQVVSVIRDASHMH